MKTEDYKRLLNFVEIRNLVPTMRAWLMDCFYDEDSQYDIAEASDIAILKAVHRYREGGLHEFVMATF